MTKRAEKLTILAARIMECEEQLTKSATIPAYNDSIYKSQYQNYQKRENKIYQFR